MAKKSSTTLLALTGIALAVGVAWWVQNRAPAPGDSGGGAKAMAAGGGGGGSGGAQRPPAVEVAQVTTTQLVDAMSSVGSLRSRQGVMLRPEVAGRVSALNFRDGERVQKGQVLVQLDDLLQQAQLRQSAAELGIAKANHKRNQELLAQNFISQRTVDESAANLEVAQAKLALSEATVQRLKVVAPFDGTTGIRNVSVGDYLKDGADIVNVEDMNALLVDFRLPERFQAKVRTGQEAIINVDALPGRPFKAMVLAVDPLVDANGRSIGVRGCVDNRAMMLRPGMYARVNAVFGQEDRALVVPEEALVPQGQRAFVFKLEDGPDKTRISKRVEVTLGIRRPGQVQVVTGLSAGDTVVVAGQQRLQRDGTAVTLIASAGGAAEGAGPKGPGAGGAAAAGPGAAAGSSGAPGASSASASASASASDPPAPPVPPLRPSLPHRV